MVAAFKRLRPSLEALHSQHFCGEIGKAQQAKKYATCGIAFFFLHFGQQCSLRESPRKLSATDSEDQAPWRKVVTFTSGYA